jgi:cobalamin biosynthesis Co2+ chelatase CbiK
MIEKWEDLDVNFMRDDPEVILEKIKDKLGVTLQDMQSALSQHLTLKYEKVVETAVNIAPHNDFSKLIEDKSEMAIFF